MTVVHAAVGERLLKGKRVYGDGSKTGVSKTQWYRLIQRGEAPSPVKLSARSVAWKASEIEAWINSRPVKGANHE